MSDSPNLQTLRTSHLPVSLIGPRGFSLTRAFACLVHANEERIANMRHKDVICLQCGKKRTVTWRCWMTIPPRAMTTRTLIQARCTHAHGQPRTRKSTSSRTHTQSNHAHTRNAITHAHGFTLKSCNSTVLQIFYYSTILIKPLRYKTVAA